MSFSGVARLIEHLEEDSKIWSVITEKRRASSKVPSWIGPLEYFSSDGYESGASSDTSTRRKGGGGRERLSHRGSSRLSQVSVSGESSTSSPVRTKSDENAEFNTLVLDSMSICVVVQMGLDGRIMYVSPALKSVFGYFFKSSLYFLFLFF